MFAPDLPTLSLNFGGALGPDGSPLGDPLDPAVIPIFPGVEISLEGAMDMAFGFDTRGLLQFKESGYQDYGKVFNGFFVSDQHGPNGPNGDLEQREDRAGPGGKTRKERVRQARMVDNAKEMAERLASAGMRTAFRELAKERTTHLSLPRA